MITESNREAMTPYQLAVLSISACELNDWRSVHVAAIPNNRADNNAKLIKFNVEVESRFSELEQIVSEATKAGHHYMQRLLSNQKRKLDLSATELPAHSDASNINMLRQKIDAYLQSRFNDSECRCQQAYAHTISVECKALSLYLHCPPNHYETTLFRPLVIAKLGFEQTGTGHGTDLLRFLVAHAKPLNISNIVLESVSKNAIRFARARGFRQCPSNHQNWYALIEDIDLPTA